MRNWRGSSQLGTVKIRNRKLSAWNVTSNEKMWKQTSNVILMGLACVLIFNIFMFRYIFSEESVGDGKVERESVFQRMESVSGMEKGRKHARDAHHEIDSLGDKKNVKETNRNFWADFIPSVRIGSWKEEKKPIYNDKKTMVVYVYNAANEEQQKNFAFFLRYGITDDNVTYRIIITKDKEVLDFPKLPSLPSNAAYLLTSSCTTIFGAMAAVMPELPASSYNYILVVDSSVRGPFMPSYASSYHHSFHWTDAFTNKLNDTIKLVGAWISCEGAPSEGNAAGYWRMNPYVSPSVFATDSYGWELITSKDEIMTCHESEWKRRYFSDAGASLEILKAGKGLDCLLTRYQNVDWTSPANWQCNKRVRPDIDLHYDGISMTPYETLFIPISSKITLQRSFSAKIAHKYEEWMDNGMRLLKSKHGVEGNDWISQHWQLKAEKLVYMNARGPDCFDFDFYIDNNPDLATISGDILALWENFMLVGQFQDRPHKFKCPFPIGNSYRISYVLSRGLRCFDFNYYQDQYDDLSKAGITDPQDLFEHFAHYGQFEGRTARFTCADTFIGLPTGFDNPETLNRDTKLDKNDIEFMKKFSLETPEETASRIAREQEKALLMHGDANDPVQQALKGVLVGEAVKSFSIKKKSKST